MIVCCPLQMFFTVSKRMHGQTIFIVVESSQAQYLIKNKLANINLRISQADTKECQDVEVGTELPFAWTNFELVDPLLAVNFFFGDIPLTPDTNKELLFSLDDLNEYQTANLSVDGQKTRVYVSTFRDATQALKVIEFNDEPAPMVIKASQSPSKRGVALQIASLTVSCI